MEQKIDALMQNVSKLVKSLRNGSSNKSGSRQPYYGPLVIKTENSIIIFEDADTTTPKSADSIIKKCQITMFAGTSGSTKFSVSAERNIWEQN